MSAPPSFEERLFEAIGTHFVDVFFNHIYALAQKQAQAGDARSVTSAYQDAVAAYVQQVGQSGAAYQQTVNQLHLYVKDWVSMGANDYATFVDRTVACLVPDDYFADLTPKQKDELFSQMVSNVLAGMAVYCTKAPKLALIVDQHSARAASTIEEMQNYASSLLVHEQSRLSNMFLSVASGAKGVDSAELVAGLKGMIRELAEKTAALEAELEEQGGELRRVQGKYSGLKSKHKGLVERLQGAQARVGAYGAAAPPPGPALAAGGAPAGLAPRLEAGPPAGYGPPPPQWGEAPPPEPAAGGFSVASRMMPGAAAAAAGAPPGDDSDGGSGGDSDDFVGDRL